MGTKFAKGSLLLFTDADTIHLPDSLSTAVQALHTRNAVLLSAPSFHLNMHWWEKLMGPFHFLVTIAATPYNKPSLENPYAIGQYLLFDKDFYDKTGGHAAIKESLAEDVDLVKLTLICQGNYQIFTSKILYKVQMYRSFQDFISGWSRLLRLGMQYMSFSAIINSSLSILALTSIFAEGGLIRWIPTLGTLLCIWIMQHKMGNFSIWGILLFPVTITLFIFLGLRAALYRFFNTPMAWRGRVYKQPAGA
jgi:chlorobactene glucosyltransferase